MSRDKDPRYNTIEGWTVAMTILAKYLKDKKDWPIGGADHDVIYMNGGPEPIEQEYTQEQLDSDEPPPSDDPKWAPEHQEDVKTLEALGFHWDTETDGWAKFV